MTQYKTKKLHLLKGGSRAVLLVGSLAIKVPRFGEDSYGKLWGFLDGWMANRTEHKVWASSKASYLNPTTSLFFSLLTIQPRLLPLTEEQFISVSQFDCRYEHKKDSLGVTAEGEVRIVDYDGKTLC